MSQSILRLTSRIFSTHDSTSVQETRTAPPTGPFGELPSRSWPTDIVQVSPADFNSYHQYLRRAIFIQPDATAAP